MTAAEYVKEILDFCRMIHDKNEGNMVSKAFKEYDKDSNGYIDRKEMGKIAKDVLIQFDKKYTKKEKAEIKDKWFEFFDTNKDGKITIDEFRILMQTVFAKFLIEQVENCKKHPDCPQSLKELDFIKYLNEFKTTLPKEEQAMIDSFIENTKKDI